MVNKERIRVVKFVTWVGAIINILLSILKLIAGIIGNSSALIADAVHTLSDLATDIIILVGVRYWDQPPDSSHTYGHQRIETLVTLLIGMALAIVGVGIGWNALASLKEHRHSESPKIITIIIVIASIISKEWVYRWTVKNAKAIKSDALLANAWHHRSDALSSIPVAAAIGIAIIFPEWQSIDHFGAAIVAVFILQAAWSIMFPALKVLVDSGAPKAVAKRCKELAVSVPYVITVHALRTRYGNGGYSVDMHVLVPGELTVRQGHDIASKVHDVLIADPVLNVNDVVVHIEPDGDIGNETEFMDETGFTDIAN